MNFINPGKKGTEWLWKKIRGLERLSVLSLGTRPHLRFERQGPIAGVFFSSALNYSNFHIAELNWKKAAMKDVKALVGAVNKAYEYLNAGKDLENAEGFQAVSALLFTKEIGDVCFLLSRKALMKGNEWKNGFELGFLKMSGLRSSASNVWAPTVFEAWRELFKTYPEAGKAFPFLDEKMRNRLVESRPD